VQDAADHPPIIHAILAAYVHRQKRLDLLPLLVAQPKQVASHDDPPLAVGRESLSDSALNTFIEFRP
jgi:hypothetical protein